MHIKRPSLVTLPLLACLVTATPPADSAHAADGARAGTTAPFQVEEATISGIQDAIRSGATSCAQVVEAYLARARAYNGVCTALVTADGKPIPAARGAVRAGSPLSFPTRTVKASTVFPQLDQYQGLPLDYGRMEHTVSDPSVQAQMGMRVGLPDAGQVNALETLNLRGERSVTCKGALDAPLSAGPLPAGAPPECERLRQLPDAREQAAALDAQYGAHPDVAKLPMYCAVVAFKDVYDTKDMRTTANNDVNFAMDVPPKDATVVARLRDKGAIIYAKSVAHEFNGGPGTPGGPEKAKTNLVSGGQGMGAWAGQPCNPYDTERVVRGSSSGSGAAIAANLATVGICEQSGASCQGPASRNGIVTLLTTKGLTPDGGGIGYQWINDRAGIHARTLPDATRVLDALRDPQLGYYDPHDPFTALPRGLIPADGYASAVLTDAMLQATPKPLQGLRIAIVREHMVQTTANHRAISQQLDGEIKRVLRDRLGAELVETQASGYPDDPDVPNLAYSFNDALSELLPRFMPEIFKRRDAKGKLFFDVPGEDVTSYEYLLKLSRREAPLTQRVNITNFATFAAAACLPSLCPDTVFDLDRYLKERGDTRITSWADWVANAKFRDDAGRAGAVNWLNFKDHWRDGKSDTLARSVVARLALQMVMERNGIAAFVHPENTVPTPKIQGPNVGSISLDGITPFFQIPKIAVPAGFTSVIVEPSYALNEARTDYVSVIAPGTTETALKHPLPISLTLFAGPGDERTLIRIGTAYEAATHHRSPPPDFGPVAGSAAKRRH
jgi:Asp-tRNA(Asn)/Glu-tRNA(Gln) amidotransferase A subunit family amidase